MAWGDYIPWIGSVPIRFLHWLLRFAYNFKCIGLGGLLGGVIFTAHHGFALHLVLLLDSLANIALVLGAFYVAPCTRFV